MKFTKCVIGSNYTPVGFVYENNGVERYEDFASLCRRNASDGKLYFSESGVFGLYKNTENAIDICRETVGGGYSAPIDPSLTLAQRIISGGKVVGFVVQDSTGVVVKKHIASILSASKYMKPANYKVVERAGNQFLQGKGVKLSTLPVIDITPGLTTTKKPRTVRSEPHDVVDPKLTKGISLVNLVQIVKGCGGAIFKMPEDDYKPVGAAYVEDGIGFTRVKSACEISAPRLETATKKLSASFNYRVPGMLMTMEGPALAYIFRKKNIVNIHYENGVLRGDKVRLDRFGIAIPEENKSKFQTDVAGTISVTPMENQSAEDTAIKLVQIQNPVLFAVDVKEISVLGSEYEDYLMAGVQIKATLEHIAKHKYIVNFLKKTISGLRERGVSLGPVPLWKYYGRFTPSAVMELRDAGVDTTSGIYNDNNKSQRQNSRAVAKTENVEIIYELEEKLEVPKDAEAVLNMTVADLPQVVQNALSAVVTELDPLRRLKIAENIKDISEVAYKTSESTLFYHKVAMLLDGNNAVHNHDKDEWSSASVSARAQFVKYVHTSGVVMKLRQITMSK